MCHRGRVIVVLAVCLALVAVPVSAHAAVDPPPGGPILVVTSSADPFTSYYTEILRAEGLNEFSTADVSALSAQTLDAYSVVVLGARGLSGAQASLLSNWVQAGGNLIAMRPDATLAGVLGIAPTGSTLSNADLRVNTAQPPGAGITANVMQFHDTADRYALDGARAVATLYQGPGTPTSNPAVTLRDVGSAGGQAAAFTFDLARSIVYTRQGNPAWAGQERDGESPPIRSDDLFFGAKTGDVQPDWVDLDRVATPGADEQQRLLANLITEMSADRVPLPRFWYLPHGLKAAVVLTGDDHGSGSDPQGPPNGTKGQFDRYLSESAPGCSVADWQCIRSTSYIFPGTPISNAEVAAYQAQGFEIALHLWVSGTTDGSANPGDKNCFNFPSAQGLNGDFDLQLAQFRQLYPSAATPSTSRTHCIVWSDWSTEASAEAAHGVRLDASYYYWPGTTWLKDRPGFFTGSGFPMRFASANGSLIDTYQAATQLTDESQQTISTEAPALFDGALGPQGFYGVITANMHTDLADNPDADTLVAAAKARGVPVISARQLLTWMDGRNGSSFQGVAFDSPSGQMTFRLAPGAGARGLQAMVPAASGTGALLALSRDGQPVGTETRIVKGVTYAVFDAAAGSYVATYPPGPPKPSTGSSTVTTGGSATQKSATANPAVVQVLPRSVAAPTFPHLKRSGSSLRPGAGRTFALLFRLPRTASVALTFRNANGKVVRAIKAPRHAKGTVLRLRWDGRDTRGRYVANGSYRFTLTATAPHYKKSARGSLRILGSPAAKAKRRAVGSVPALSGAARAAAMARLAARLRAAAPTALCSLAY